MKRGAYWHTPDQNKTIFNYSTINNETKHSQELHNTPSPIFWTKGNNSSYFSYALHFKSSRWKVYRVSSHFNKRQSFAPDKNCSYKINKREITKKRYEAELLFLCTALKMIARKKNLPSFVSFQRKVTKWCFGQVLLSFNQWKGNNTKTT